MARRLVLGQKELAMEEVKAGCKYHPERETVVDRHGRSTGMCSECLSGFGKRGAENKWRAPLTPALSPAGRGEEDEDVLAVISERVAMAVLGLARPGAEQAVLGLLLGEIRMRAAALVKVMAKGAAG